MAFNKVTHPISPCANINCDPGLCPNLQDILGDGLGLVLELFDVIPLSGPQDHLLTLNVRRIRALLDQLWVKSHDLVLLLLPLLLLKVVIQS